MYGLAPIGNAASAAPITTIWAAAPAFAIPALDVVLLLLLAAALPLAATLVRRRR
jgi:hypothetical protein